MAYKVFTNGSVLNASEINDNLMNQSVMVFSNATARSAALTSPLEGMLTWLEDSNKYQNYNGSAWVDLGGSAILQVKSTTLTTPYTMASSTFATVTGLSVSITPTSATSKILVTVSLNATSDSNRAAEGRVVRDSTPIFIGDASGSRSRSSFFFGAYVNATGTAMPNSISSNVSANVLDEPATTSAITYAVQVRRLNLQAADATVYVNRTGANSDNSDHGVYASTITVMEVAG